MDDLLQRLKRERRVAIVILAAATILIGAVQYCLAPDPPAPFVPVAVDSVSSERTQ